jgi:hypothetical protein
MTKHDQPRSPSRASTSEIVKRPHRSASADLFDARAALGDKPILHLEALPPAVLVRYAARSALRLIPGDPNMAPLQP